MNLNKIANTALVTLALGLIVSGLNAQSGGYGTLGGNIIAPPTGTRTPLVIAPNGYPYGFNPYYNAFANPYYNTFNGYDMNGSDSGNGFSTNPGANLNNTANAAMWQNAIPRTNDSIEATREGNYRIRLRWQGEPQAVSQITFSLLDKNRRPVRTQVVTSPPAEARLTRTRTSAYYQVLVEYVNGTTTSVVSPL